MSRPFFRHTIVQLEELYKTSISNKAELKLLEAELKHRQLPRAQALLQKVQQTLAGSQSELPLPPVGSPLGNSTISTPGTVRMTTASPAITQPGLPAEKQPAPPPLSIRPSVSNFRSDGGEISPVDSSPAISLEAAYRLLACAPNTNWETIERTRRQLVLKSHPARLQKLSASEKNDELKAAQNANSAYMVLLAARLRQ